MSDLSIHNNDVHIWSASLSHNEFLVEKFSQLVSTDELIRSKHFFLHTDKTKYIINHGILRAIIASYLNIEPPEILYNYNESGKPEINFNNIKGNKLFFNMSYSEGIALFAFSRHANIGVDIEKMRDLPEMDTIVRLNFTEFEKIIYNKLPNTERKRAFFLWWTRKEAIIKAIGQGIHYPFKKISMSFIPDEAARINSIGNKSNKASKWTLKNLNIHNDFAAACAIEGEKWCFKFYKWDDFIN